MVGQAPSVIASPRMVGSQWHCVTQLLSGPHLTPGPPLSLWEEEQDSHPGA